VYRPFQFRESRQHFIRVPFRLYFVDTTESRVWGKRSEEQAAYFGVTRAEAIKLGEEAKAFTAAALQRPFTIQTRWRKVFGPTRYYACVFTADGKDLAELLVRNGLARIYGTRTALPDGSSSRTYLATLAGLEQQAKFAGLGGWRH
jgi:endonuclease YncB( thermonuclease family)